MPPSSQATLRQPVQHPPASYKPCSCLFPPVLTVLPVPPAVPLSARAMLMKADILLLDEPTNHLDTKNVAWLENYLVTR